MDKKIFRNGRDIGNFKRMVLEKHSAKKVSADIIIYTDSGALTYRYIESYCNKSIDGMQVDLYDALSLGEEVNIHITEYVPNEIEGGYIELLMVELEHGSFDGWKFIFDLDITADLEKYNRVSTEK